MLASLLVAMAIASAGGTGSAASDCKTAAREAWPVIALAIEDPSAAGPALAALDRIEPLCAGDRGIADLLNSAHADIDLRRGRADAVVARLSAKPLASDHPLWPTSQWTLLAALEVTGDADRFRAVRDAFLTEHDRVLTSGPSAMRRVERFETPDAVIDAYEGEILNGPFVRVLIFVAAPRNGGMPATLSIGLDPAADALLGVQRGGGKAYFLDYYPCEMHATLGIVERGATEGPPPYAEMKKRAIRQFTGETALAPFARRETPRFCAFESFMLPGFSRGDDDS